MNIQLRQCFARAKPFRLKKKQNRKSEILSGFLISKKGQWCSKEARIQFWFQKSQISNPDQQFSIFIFADTYTGQLYYIIIRFLCRAQSIIAKFAHPAQIQVANSTGRLL